MHPLVLALAIPTACDSTKSAPAPSTVEADTKTTSTKTADAKTPEAKTDTKVALDGKEVIDEGKNAEADPDTKVALDGKSPVGDTKAPPGAEAPSRYSPLPGLPSPDAEDDAHDWPIYREIAGKPVAPAPKTVAEASKQLAAWLNEPEKSPVPGLLFAAGDVEVAIHCGPCVDHALSNLYKTSSTAEFGLLVSQIPYEGWSAGDDQKCDERCCTFGPQDNAGSGATNLEKVCMAVDARGKPTAYTRIVAADQ